MSKDIKWIDQHIEIAPIKKNKKITGTRLGAILGMNRWTTPFATWCEITRTYEKPFEDNIYTNAGKVIEPIVIDYLKTHLFMELESPTDVYGENPFKKTYGDFYKDIPIFGGMWDARSKDGSTIIEIKTTKRSEDWLTDVPPYYKIQGALYAFLSGCQRVVFPCVFLSDADYDHPEAFKPMLGKNIVLYDFNLDDIYPNFEEGEIQQAIDFWQDHVLTGISPDYDADKDKDILKALRKDEMEKDEDMDAMLARIDELQAKVSETYDSMVKPLEDELDALLKKLKKAMTEQISDTIDKVEVRSGRSIYTLSKTFSTTIDKKALEADGLLGKYSKQSESFRLTNKVIKEKE